MNKTSLLLLLLFISAPVWLNLDVLAGIEVYTSKTAASQTVVLTCIVKKGGREGGDYYKRGRPTFFGGVSRFHWNAPPFTPALSLIPLFIHFTPTSEFSAGRPCVHL